ncbi:MAG TPA: site-2 protease family protein [Verrucomicrobiota bacterium]|jgi:Zn-dependent protease|nr:site-2 protease family protein [Verrucomicrobiota bacterium]HQL79743.1 site-2 protease family protein [Verrucomicrobiota bacterium]
MDWRLVIEGLILYLGLLVLLTFHEFGHAWMAWKCGDDTARSQGRVSLNPLVHIDPFGTVALPLLLVFMAPGGFLIGWAKPVPVNSDNFRNPRSDDIMVTLAGPWMNLLLAVGIMALARVDYAVHSPSLTEVSKLCLSLAHLSLLLCFFNLLPIPPLDGSQVVRSLVGMSHETYYQIARYGIFILIVVLQVPLVQRLLNTTTTNSWLAIAGWFGMPVGA